MVVLPLLVGCFLVGHAPPDTVCVVSGIRPFDRTPELTGRCACASAFSNAMLQLNYSCADYSERQVIAMLDAN